MNYILFQKKASAFQIYNLMMIHNKFQNFKKINNSLKLIQLMKVEDKARKTKLFIFKINSFKLMKKINF